MSSTPLEKLYPAMFVFGKNRKTGLVDIATPNDDTFISCSSDHADKLVAERDGLLRTFQQVIDLAHKHAPRELEALLENKHITETLFKPFGKG